MLVSQREYARMIGVSHVAVGKMVKGGVIPLVDGKIDPDVADRARRDNCDPSRVKGRTAAKTGRKSSKKKAPETRPTPEPPLPEGTDDEATLAAARLRGENLKNRKRQLEIDEAEKRLVDRARTVQTVFALARELREYWQTWPARVAPDMAAELGVSPKDCQRVLDRLVREHLADMADGKLRI